MLEEGPYRSPLLDEIHKHFPALLYDSEQFRTLPQVFTYVHRQMQRRFDTYTNAREEYRQANPPRTARGPRPQQQPHPFVAPVPLATGQPRQIPATPPPVRRLHQTPPPLVVEPVTVGQLEAMELLQSMFNTPTNSFQQQAMDILSGFGLPNNAAINYEIPILTGASGFTTFLDSVPVVPTQAQIAAATVVETVTTPINLDDACAVCQEPYTEGTETRRIRHCTHRFHKRCIDRWFQQHVGCPMCRHDIRNTD